MAAAQKLLVDIFMAAATVTCCQLTCRNHETVMVFLLLPGRSLMAIQAVHALLSVLAHLILNTACASDTRRTFRWRARNPRPLAPFRFSGVTG